MVADVLTDANYLRLVSLERLLGKVVLSKDLSIYHALILPSNWFSRLSLTIFARLILLHLLICLVIADDVTAKEVVDVRVAVDASWGLSLTCLCGDQYFIWQAVEHIRELLFLLHRLLYPQEKECLLSVVIVDRGLIQQVEEQVEHDCRAPLCLFFFHSHADMNEHKCPANYLSHQEVRQPVRDQEVTRDDEGESVQKVLISSDKLKDFHLRHHY